MWMSYKNYTEITDLRSGVQHLCEQFMDLAWDADHESVYGLGRYLSETDCLLEAKGYRRAKELCEKFLAMEINIKELYEGLKEISLDGFLKILKPYISTIDVTFEASENEEEEEEEESDGEERCDEVH